MWDWYWLLRAAGGEKAVRGYSGTLLCVTGTGYWGSGGSETAVRGTERNGIVWDWYWLLGAAGG